MKRIFFALITLIWALGLSAIGLQESVTIALDQNSSLLMAREEVAIADQSRAQVQGGLYPQLTLQGKYSLARTHLPKAVQLPPVNIGGYLNPETSTDNDYLLAAAISGIANNLIPSSPMDEGSLAASLQLDQVLFAGGRLANGMKATERYREITRLNLEMKEQDVVLQTEKLFYSCLLTEKVIAVQEEALGLARRHLVRVEAFYREGMVSEFDVLRARLEVAKLEPQLLEAQGNYDLALAAFRTHLGRADEDLTPEGEFEMPQTLQISLDEALTLGTQNRAELAMASMASEVKELQWKVEKGALMPSVGLQASAALYTKAEEFAIHKDDFGTNFSIGLGFSIPIFDGMQSLAKVRAAKHDYMLSRLQQQDFESLIRLQITQDYKKLNNALQNHNVQEKNIEIAERGLELARVRYESQTGIQLEVFDAQTTLSAIKMQYYHSIYEVISATRELQRSLGLTLYNGDRS
jgi:outer membrane protein TolC